MFADNLDGVRFPLEYSMFLWLLFEPNIFLLHLAINASMLSSNSVKSILSVYSISNIEINTLANSSPKLSLIMLIFYNNGFR